MVLRIQEHGGRASRSDLAQQVHAIHLESHVELQACGRPHLTHARNCTGHFSGPLRSVPRATPLLGSTSGGLALCGGQCARAVGHGTCPSASVPDGRFIAVADAAPGSGNAGGREEHAHSEVSAMVDRPALCAADLPTHLTVGDGRNGLVALREFVKRWACFPQQRPMMIAQVPRRLR